MPYPPKTFQQFQEKYPDIYATYEELGKKIAECGPIDHKTRELIKLGMAAGRQAESSVHSHVHRALDAGATAAEIEHAVLLGITTLGFPATMAALSWAKEALADH